MADTYRLIAGLVIFIVFLFSALALAAQTFPDLAPAGSNPANAVPSTAKPAFGTPVSCFSGDWTCAISSFVTTTLNDLAAGVAIMGGVIGMFFALLTFQIPALQVNIFTRLFNLLLIIPIIVVLSLFVFNLVKSVIPTVGGDIT